MKRLLWRFHHATSLTVKLSIPGMLVSIVVFAVIAVVIEQAMNWEITRQYEERARGIAVFLDHEVGAGGTGDPLRIAAARIAPLMAAYPDLFGLTVYARVGSGYAVVASSDRAQIGAKADPLDLEPLTTGLPLSVEIGAAGHRILKVNYPVQQRGAPVAVLGIQMSLLERDLRLATLRRWTMTIAVLASLGILGVNYTVAKAAVVAPLRKLLEATEAVASGNLAIDLRLGWEEVPQAGTRFEVARFAQALRAMVDRLRDDREALRHLAITDPVTGLHNRRFFNEIIQQELARANRFHQPFAVAAVEVNSRQDGNGRAGGHAEDRLVQRAADFLKRTVRISDEVIRWDGDDFLILMPHTDSAQAAKVAERFGAAVGHESGLGHALHLSVGIAAWEPGKDLERILCEAKTAMYEAKHLASSHRPW